jgi:hypothetical protein
MAPNARVAARSYTHSYLDKDVSTLSVGLVGARLRMANVVAGIIACSLST